MSLINNKSTNHVQYNGDETTLLDIKRRHIKENQTIYSGSYAIKNKPVQTPITSSVPLWQSQPARSEVERLVYFKNDILRQMMDWVGGDWVGSVDYGKNTIITYDAPDDLKQKTDWNENFDQAIADNFGMQLCTGDLPISIQMANYICWRENGVKFGDMDHAWKDTELNGYYMPMDHTSTPHKTYALGMMYTSMDDGETLTDIETLGSLDPNSIWNCWIGLAKYAAKDILKHCGSFTPNQNQLDSLVRRWYSAPASCYKICRRLAAGESPDSVYANWIHFQDCTEKGNTAGHVKTYESQRPVMTRNCEECRNWFIGLFPENIPGLGNFEEWTYGADMVGASGGSVAGNYSISGAVATPTPSSESEMHSQLGMGNVTTVAQANACANMMVTIPVANTGFKVTVHKKLANAFSAAFNDIVKTGFKIKAVGGFCARTKNNGTGTSSLSSHSFGAAIDINGFCGNPFFSGRAEHGNQTYNSIPSGATFPDWAHGYKTGGGGPGYNPNICIWTRDHPVVQIMRKHGFGWGGRYGDTMHFSWTNYGN